MSSSFDEKAAKKYLDALTAALLALKTVKAASPKFLFKNHAVQIDKAITAALRAHLGASAQIDALARQMVLPHMGPKKSKRGQQMKLLH